MAKKFGRGILEFMTGNSECPTGGIHKNIAGVEKNIGGGMCQKNCSRVELPIVDQTPINPGGALLYIKVTRVCVRKAPVQTKTSPKIAPCFSEIPLKSRVRHTRV